MRHLLTASFAALACLLAQPASAQSRGGVPILQAPYHLPVFKNEFVTLLNVMSRPAAIPATTSTRPTAFRSMSKRPT